MTNSETNILFTTAWTKELFSLLFKTEKNWYVYTYHSTPKHLYTLSTVLKLRFSFLEHQHIFQENILSSGDYEHALTKRAFALVLYVCGENSHAEKCMCLLLVPWSTFIWAKRLTFLLDFQKNDVPFFPVTKGPQNSSKQLTLQKTRESHNREFHEVVHSSVLEICQDG